MTTRPWFGLAVLTLVGCASCASPDQVLLDAFFDASRLRDTTALQNLATVTYEPLQDGIVRSYRIVAVTPPADVNGTPTRDVTVEGTVALPDGRDTRKTLVVTLQRIERNGQGARWMVTRVRNAATPTAEAPQQ